MQQKLHTVSKIAYTAVLRQMKSKLLLNEQEKKLNVGYAFPKHIPTQN